jgi:hypothetical protein
VENYLEVAKAQGFDVVVTLSNDLAPVGGDHPVTVDRRKLKKVTLHHISWSEVLHEARMQLDHRGIEDRVQAWILAELIRYLHDPRSGAAGFEDMGAAWVPIREAVAARTLRPSDKRIGEVATSWDKLVRHLCLRLNGQLGVTVSPVVPRALANAPAARVQTSIVQLADDGRLSATVRIPQAVGLLTIVADVRVGQSQRRGHRRSANQHDLRAPQGRPRQQCRAHPRPCRRHPCVQADPAFALGHEAERPARRVHPERQRGRRRVLCPGHSTAEALALHTSKVAGERR